MTPLHVLSPGRLRTAAIFAALTLCVVLVRLPYVSNAGVDEAFYLVVGRQWLEGHLPYADAFDVKPPLLFALMAAAEAVFGPSLLAAKVLTMAAVSVTACALYLFGRRWLGEVAGLMAALFYIASTVTLGGTFSPAELLTGPFTAIGMLAGVSAALAPGRPRALSAFGAGLCLGAAACVKQTAIFEALPLAAFLFFRQPMRDGLCTLAWFGTGFVVVPAGFSLFFFAEGHFTALFADAVLAAAGRASAQYVSWGEAFSRLGIDILLVLPIVVMALGVCLIRVPFRGPTDPALGFLAAWLAGGLAGVLATRAMLVIYFLPLVQPLSLMAGLAVQECVEHVPRRKGRGLVAVALAIVAGYSACLTAPLVFSGRENLASARAAAAAMQAAGLRRDDRILVADRDLIVYLASGAHPPGPVFHPLQLLCDFAFPDAASSLADSLNSRPAFIVTAEPAYARDCEMPGRRSLLDSVLRSDYCPISRVGSTLTGGGPGSLAVYKALADALKSRPAFIAVAEPAYPLGCERPDRRAPLQSTLAAGYRHSAILEQRRQVRARSLLPFTASSGVKRIPRPALRKALRTR